MDELKEILREYITNDTLYSILFGVNNSLIGVRRVDTTKDQFMILLINRIERSTKYGIVEVLKSEAYLSHLYPIHKYYLNRLFLEKKINLRKIKSKLCRVPQDKVDSNINTIFDWHKKGKFTIVDSKSIPEWYLIRYAKELLST